MERSGRWHHPDCFYRSLQLYHNTEEIREGDFTKIPGGMPGAETRGTLVYTYGVDKGRITKEDMCRVLSENPAKLYGLYPRKGVIVLEVTQIL